MSTIMIIARPDADDPAKYQGIYVHGDGYPTHGGKHLHAHVLHEFGGDLDAALTHYIDNHPAGWSSLSEVFGQEECYCCDHGEGKEITAFHTQDHERGNDWTYVLRPEGMEIRRYDKGIVATVPWDADHRVDWKAIEKAGYAL